MIILRSPKGWTGPKEVDGKKTEGFWRHTKSPGRMDKPEHISCLRVDEKLSARRAVRCNGRLKPELAALAPRGIAVWVPIRTPTAGCCSKPADAGFPGLCRGGDEPGAGEPKPHG